MPHVCLVAMSAVRVMRPELRALGATLPGLAKRGAAIGQLPALGALTLGGMLPAHWTCSLHTPQDGDASLTDVLADALADQRPTLVAISALTASILDARRLANELRSRRIPTVLGGLHATACAATETEYFDAVVVGDGESAWPAVLADAEARQLHGVYRSHNRFDLNDAPLPRFDLLSQHHPPRFTVQTQRGCPLACEFCAASRLLGSFREKPLHQVRTELQAIAEFDPHAIVELADDNTFAGRRDAIALCECLGEFDFRYFTESDWRIGERPELLDALAAAGCVQVLIGIESLVHSYEGMGAKRQTAMRVSDALAAIQDRGIAVIGCYVVGADGETRETIDALAEHLDESRLADVQLTVQTPFPGSPLYDRLGRDGRLLSDRTWNHYTLFDVTYRPSHLSVEELEHAFAELMQWTYRPHATKRRTAIRRSIWANHPRLGRSRSLRWHDS